MQLRVFMLVIATVLVATACGGDGDSTSGVASLDVADTSTSAPDTAGDDGAGAAVDQEQAMLDFAACMRDNGIEIDDPTVDSDGNVQFGGFRGAAQDPEADRDQIRGAFEACHESLAGIALGRSQGIDQTELQDTLLEYAACMRDNGYDMDDPDLSAFGPGAGGDREPGEGGGGPFGEIDPNDPDFITAQEACQDVLGGFGPGGGGGLGRTSGGDA